MGASGSAGICNGFSRSSSNSLARAKIDRVMDKWLEDARRGKLLDVNVVLNMCEILKEVLAGESNVVSISTPVTVCGDLHGQFDDLVEMFRINGEPPKVNYLFLGDYGKFGQIKCNLIFTSL